MSFNYPYNLGLLFYKVADANASRTALKFPSGDIFTYREFNELSNKIARALLANEIKKGDVVAIFNEKSFYAWSLMLACLKVGAIYTNLDTTSPWPRLQKILNTCTPKIIFSDSENTSVKHELNNHFSGIPVMQLQQESFQQSLHTYEDNNLQQTGEIAGTDPAYIMFTSGSTGFPKGAVISHSNVLNFIQWGRQTFEVTAEDIFTNANPVYFDNSVFDFYTSIFNGATLVPLANELLKNTKHLVQAINDSKCTIWFSVPSLLVYLLTTKALTKNDFSSIRSIAFGGEGFPKNKLRQLYHLFAERITLYNVYGPTECTCICSSYIISAKDFDNMNELAPLGFMAPNVGYEILSPQGTNKNLGELALSGSCVGLGYYNDAERTAQSFVQNGNSPFFNRMYKTGDIVERAQNGYLHFRGRADNQVKHMGYRIELEEVEAAFNTLPYINESGVVYEKISEDLGQVIAFVSLSDASKDTVHILEDIKNLLPTYMIPRKIKILEMLPKNSNGKIDRKQLALL